MRQRAEFWRRKRPDGSRGRTYWTNLGGKRVSTEQTNLEDARRWKAARLRERADPRLAAAEKATLGDAVRDVYAELRRRDRSAATQKRAKQKLGHFLRLWGEDCKLATIEARKIGEYIDTRLEEPGAKEGTTVARITIRDELAFLRQLLKIARRIGNYAHAIDDVLPLIFETGHVPKKTWCKERDFPKLLRRVEERHAAHLAYIVATGCRLSESLRARRGDADLATYRVLIRGSKTELSWSTIAIPTRLRRWLRYALQHAEGERGSDELLFRDWPNIRRDMKAACSRAGIPEVGPHDLRRTSGKWMRLWGFDLEEIAKFLRHTDPKLAREVYADVEGEELSAVVDNAEARIRGYKNRTGRQESGQN